MSNRSHYLPRASVLDKMSDHDRAAVFDQHRRQLEEDVGRTVLTSQVGRRKFLKSARDRMRRLERLAQSYGCWLPEPEYIKIPKAEFLEIMARVERVAARTEEARSFINRRTYGML